MAIDDALIMQNSTKLHLRNISKYTKKDFHCDNDNQYENGNGTSLSFLDTFVYKEMDD